MRKQAFGYCNSDPAARAVGTMCLVGVQNLGSLPASEWHAVAAASGHGGMQAAAAEAAQHQQLPLPADAAHIEHAHAPAAEHAQLPHADAFGHAPYAADARGFDAAAYLQQHAAGGGAPATVPPQEQQWPTPAAYGGDAEQVGQQHVQSHAGEASRYAQEYADAGAQHGAQPQHDLQPAELQQQPQQEPPAQHGGMQQATEAQYARRTHAAQHEAQDNVGNKPPYSEHVPPEHNSHPKPHGMASDGREAPKLEPCDAAGHDPSAQTVHHPAQYQGDMEQPAGPPSEAHFHESSLPVEHEPPGFVEHVQPEPAHDNGATESAGAFKRPVEV